MKKCKIKIISICIAIICTLSSYINVYAVETSKGSDYLLMVNKDKIVDEKYLPNDLKEISKNMPCSKESIKLREDAADALLKMYADMKANGIDMVGISGYRSYEYQTGLFNREVKTYKSSGYSKEKAKEAASKSTAIPGSSEHQLGLAIDVSSDFDLDQSFETTDAGKWLADNSYKYGYILRYAKEKVDITGIIYEPWHFRFVGKPHAEYMKKNNLCLEEYIELLAKNKDISFTSETGDAYKISRVTEFSDALLNASDVSKDNTGGYIVTVNDSLSQNQPIENIQIQETKRTVGVFDVFFSMLRSLLAL